MVDLLIWELLVAGVRLTPSDAESLAFWAGEVGVRKETLTRVAELVEH